MGRIELPTSCSQSVQEFLVGKMTLLDSFVNDKKATKGLTTSGEYWLRENLSRFLTWLTLPIEDVRREQIVEFLAMYDGKPWRKHSLYRALRTFWKWVSIHHAVPNPYIDRFGNSVIEPPKTPKDILYTVTPESVRLLIAAASGLRDKAIISLLADSGVRRSELANIQVEDIDLERHRIKVQGKGGKEGFLVFGEATAALITHHMTEAQPQGLLFGLNSYGVQTMLRRLAVQTGIRCNAHSFRRGFATELRRKGLSGLDIAELGRWSSVEMVMRYSQAYTFDDAAKRYKPIVE